MNISRTDKGIILPVHVTPRAKKSEIIGILGESLSIRISAPPLEGKANKILEKYLAHFFELPANRVNIIKGEKSRNKIVLMEGISLEKVKEKLSGFQGRDNNKL